MLSVFIFHNIIIAYLPIIIKSVLPLEPNLVGIYFLMDVKSDVLVIVEDLDSELSLDVSEICLLNVFSFVLPLIEQIQEVIILQERHNRE